MPKWSFLWITDLHFASPDSNYIDDPKELNELRDEKLRDSIIRDLHTILDFDFRSVANSDSPDSLSFIAIGGDITTRGRHLGFEIFKRDTFPKLSRLVSKPDAICIVPGNHDVVWGLNPTTSGYFSAKFEPFVSVLRNRGVTSCLFPKGQLDADQPEQDQDEVLDFDFPERGPIYVDDKKRVLVLNINSSIRSGELNLKMASDLGPLIDPKASASAKGPAPAVSSISLDNFERSIRHYFIRDVAHVTQSQILKLGKELETEKRRIGDDWENYLRVALVHHHLVPFPNQNAEHKGYEATVDSSSVLQFLTSHEFDLVLTGHKHQPYVLPYRFSERDIIVIGGATVGGAAPSSSFRGIHLVEVTSNHHGRRVTVCDLPHTIAKGRIETELRNRMPKQPSAFISANSALIAAARKAGFRYRDVVSITRIKEDGDAHRLVECDDLIVTKPCSRTSSHTIELPPTSGYLDMLRAEADRKELDVYVKEGIPEGHTSKSATVELGFDPELSVNRDDRDKGVSYKYEWFAVNAFALDKLQFLRKYGTRPRNIEFTHFIPVDPIERLTVIVQFPKALKLPHPPTLRIMRVNSKNRDSSAWEIDEEEKDHLKEVRALRFFESLNIAALRVRVPKKGLSYGIQWTLPDAPKPVAPATLAAFISQLTAEPDDALKRIYRVLEFSRNALLSGWDKNLDAALMIFSMGETAGSLKTIAAGFTSGPADGDEAMQRLSRESEIVLEYGEGIAGRAFKANSIRIYQDPSIIGPQIPGQDQSRYEPNFYKTVPGTITHKTLVAFPVHLPVHDSEFDNDPNIYESREPYGVLNIGSELADCPVGQYLLLSRTPDLLPFQHRINKILAEGLFSPSKRKSK